MDPDFNFDTSQLLGNADSYSWNPIESWGENPNGLRRFGEVAGIEFNQDAGAYRGHNTSDMLSPFAGYTTGRYIEGNPNQAGSMRYTALRDPKGNLVGSQREKLLGDGFMEKAILAMIVGGATAGLGQIAGLGSLFGGGAASTGSGGWAAAMDPLAVTMNPSFGAAAAGAGAGASAAFDPVGNYLTGAGGAEGSLSSNFWSTIPGQASKGALVNGGMTAAGGGDLKDVLKSAAIGGISGGVGGWAGDSFGGSALTQRAVSGAASSATGAALNGGSLSDIFKSSALGGLSQYTPDVAGYAGITNPMASEAINGATRGGLTAALTGNNVGQSSLSGGLRGLFSAGIDKFLTPTNTGNSNMGETNPFFSNLRTSLGLDNVSGKDIGDFAQGLSGMYTGYKQRRQAKDLMALVGGRRDAYGTQLRGNLERRDAASGRRSDYGGRETQLQAALAELDSRNAPMMTQLSNAKMGGQTSILQSLLRLGGKQNWFGSQPPLQQPNMAAFNMPPANPADPYDLASIIRKQQPQFPWGS